MNIQCDWCKEYFGEDNIDLCLVDENETVWLCNDCEENHKRRCEE